MATPRPRDEEFNEESYNYDYASRSGWGIQGVRTDYGPQNSKRTAAANENAAPQSRFSRNKRSFYTEPNEPANVNTAPQQTTQQKQTITSGPSLGSSKGYAKLKAAKLRAKVISPWIFGWTTFWWSWIQIPASIFSLIMLGAAFEVSQSWILDAVTKVIQLVGELMGFKSLDIITLFFITAGVSFFISVWNFGTSWSIYTIAGIQSVYGNTGAGLKFGCIILMLIGGLPGLSLIPWFWLWIWAVTKYPQ